MLAGGRARAGGAVVDPDDLVIGDGVRIPTRELEWRFSTSSGPGGQHVNTSNTRVELRFDIAASPSLPEWARQRLLTKLGPATSVTASDARSQLRNRALALERLSARLSAALHRDPPRRATRRSRAAQQRRLEAKRQRAQRKQSRQRNWDE